MYGYYSGGSHNSAKRTYALTVGPTQLHAPPFIHVHRKWGTPACSSGSSAGQMIIIGGSGDNDNDNCNNKMKTEDSFVVRYSLLIDLGLSSSGWPSLSY